MQKRIEHSLKILAENIKMHISSQLVYRTQMVSWVLSDIITPLIFGAVWTIVAREGNSDVSQSTVVTYFILIIFFSKFLKDWSHERVMSDVISGEFSKYLLKPFNYIIEFLGINIGEKILRLLITIPVVVLLWVSLNHYISFSPSYLYVVLSLFALLIAAVLTFFIFHTFALLSFFVKQLWSLKAFHNNLYTILSGEIMPIFFMPVWAQFLTEILPYRYTISFPVEILLNRLSLSQIQSGFIIGLVWLVIFIFIYFYLLKKAVKKYEAEGI